MLIALILSQLLSPALPRPQGPIFRSGTGAPAYVYAAFEFAPPTGVGMTGECAGTNPTGAKGETLTFSRSSAATCTKGTNGLRATGIANGDLVYVSSNIIRQERDQNGVLGVLVEEGRTNSIVRSEEFDNAAWSVENIGVAAPTVTANAYAFAPVASPGSLPDRVQFPATTSGQKSMLYQSPLSGIVSTSIYARGVSGGGTFDVCNYNGSIYVCVPCTFTSTGWNRCTQENFNATSYVQFGNNTQASGVARAAVDVYLWGASQEAGAFATAYIPTTSAGVARVAETPSIPGTWPSNPNSMAATAQTPLVLQQKYALAVQEANLTMYYGANLGFGAATDLACQLFPSTSINIIKSPLTGFDRVACVSNGVASKSCIGGVCATGNGTGMPATGSLLAIGYLQGAGAQLNGIVSGICVDPDPLRCR